MRGKPTGKIPEFSGIKRDKAREIIGRAMTRGAQRPLWLEPQEIIDLLTSYGIRFVETFVATTLDEAAASAAKIGFPVAVKLVSSTITHKSDVGGVLLDLNSDDEVKRAFNDITTRLEKAGRKDEMQGVFKAERMEKDCFYCLNLT